MNFKALFGAVLLAAGAVCASAGELDVRIFSDWNQYHIDDRDRIAFEVVVNLLPEDGTGLILGWRLADIAGETVASGEIPLAGRIPPVNETIEVGVPDYGYYEFQLVLRDSEGLFYDDAVSTLARIRMQPLEFDHDGYFGINGHNHWWDSEIMRRIGVTMWRADTEWRFVEAEEGVWDFTEMDRLIDTLHANGIVILGNLCYNPPWLKLEPGQGTDKVRYHDYVRRMVERYGDKVYCWDLWNEPQFSWHGDKNDFAAMQLETYRLIKSMQPEAKIVFNAHPFEEELHGYTLEQFESLGWQVPMTALGIHPYNRPLGPDDNDFLEHMLNIRALLDSRAPEAEMWISELGWPTSNDALGVSEITQASFMARAAVYGLASQNRKFLYYQAWSGQDREWSENQYGFLNHLLQPKPALATFAHLAQRLRPLTFVRMLDLGGAARGALFSDGGKNPDLIALWATHDPVKLALTPPAAAEFQRMDGSPHPGVAPDGTLLLDDILLLIDTAAGDAWAGTLENAPLTLENPVVLKAASVVPEGLRLRLENRDKVALDVTALVALPEGVVFSDPARRGPGPVRLDFSIGRDRKELLLRLDAPERLVGETVGLELSAGGSRRELTVPWTVYTAPYLSDYRPGGAPARWPGQSGEKLDSILDIGPADMQKEWRGAGDLSVEEFRFGWNERGIILLARIRDDRHDPADTPLGMWNADSIQVAVNATPGIVPDYYDEYSAEIGAALMADGPRFQVYAGNGASGAQPEVMVVRDETAQVTLYELLIPWPLLGLDAAPGPGAMISANFIVNDKDGGPRKWIQAGNGIGIKKSPADFPRLKLVK